MTTMTNAEAQCLLLNMARASARIRLAAFHAKWPKVGEEFEHALAASKVRELAEAKIFGFSPLAAGGEYFVLAQDREDARARFAAETGEDPAGRCACCGELLWAAFDVED